MVFFCDASPQPFSFLRSKKCKDKFRGVQQKSGAPGCIGALRFGRTRRSGDLVRPRAKNSLVQLSRYQVKKFFFRLYVLHFCKPPRIIADVRRKVCFVPNRENVGMNRQAINDILCRCNVAAREKHFDFCHSHQCRLGQSLIFGP